MAPGHAKTGLPLTSALVGCLGALAGCVGSLAEDPAAIHDVESWDIRYLPTTPRFAHVQELVLVDGSLWVLDGAPPFLTRVPLSGAPVLRLGTVGRGPGEFVAPWAIQPVQPGSPGEVRVWDRGTYRVSTFDSAGEVTDSRRLSEEGVVRARNDFRKVSYADPFRLRTSGDGVLIGSFPRRVDRTADIRTGILSRANPRLELTEALIRFADFMANDDFALEEWIGVPLWDACGEALILWNPADSEVDWADLQGVILHSESLEDAPVPITLRDVEAYLRWMARMELGPDFEAASLDFPAMARATRQRFAEFRPKVTEVRCESERAIWLRTFDTSGDPLGRGPVWIRISREEAPRRYRFPLAFTPTLFTAPGAFGVVETPDGSHRLGFWARSPRPGVRSPILTNQGDQRCDASFWPAS